MSGPKTMSAEAIASGEVAKPPFAILADPGSRFARHAGRFAVLAPGHQLEPYLRFLTALSQAQHDCQDGLPPAVLPPSAEIEKAYGHGMPPISIGLFEPDATAPQTLLRILGLLQGAEMPEAARAALNGIMGKDDVGRSGMMRAIVMAEVPADEIAGHVLAAAAVQVHFSRLASQLDARRLTEVAPGACPACGGSPVASVIVELPKVSGHRYCCCSLCGTQWNVSRIRCVMCGGDKGVAYHNIVGLSDTIKAETCDGCLSYVKIFHQDKDAGLDPVADDVASLGLDLLLRKEGFHRGSANPFLLGY
ncbi:MAG: formate dehydrogenase accessory protein FdhE [Hyphomicrobiales bacterium]